MRSRLTVRMSQRIRGSARMSRQDNQDHKDPRVPPNDQLKRHPDEVYGDTDVPSKQRDDSSERLNRRKNQLPKPRKQRVGRS
jgi:hypothetical protein